MTRRPIFEFVSKEIHPDNTVVVFAFADDYSFGVLQSAAHWEWCKARCSTLGTGFGYTSDTVFDTFPWPQFEALRGDGKPAAHARHAAGEGVHPRRRGGGARALRGLRHEIMLENEWSLRAPYKSLEDPGHQRLRDAHTRLDAAVRAAHGMNAEEDVLAFLLRLNLACAAREAAGEPVTPPGLPAFVPEPESFVSRDGVRVEDGPFANGALTQAYADAAHYYGLMEATAPYGEKKIEG